MKILLLIFVITNAANAAFIKFSGAGERLDFEAKSWSCIFDNEANLLWEVKQNNQDLQGKNHTYSWFDGKSGVANGDFSNFCHWRKNCNTQAFIKALNQKNLCGVSVWRLPTEAELGGLLKYGDTEPLIDTQFFPNTMSKPYWSSDTDPKKSNVAFDVPFFYGGSKGSDKAFNSHIRAVVDVK